MPPKTLKAALVKMLENLSSENLNNFRYELLDRREEPQVRRNKVERKGPRDIAEVMVSTFTESRAVSVAQELLRDLNLGEEADRLAIDMAVLMSEPGPTEDAAVLTSEPGPTARPSAGAAGADARSEIEHISDLIGNVQYIRPILEEFFGKIKINF